MKIDSYFAFGNTLNHSIARAVNDNYCNNNKEIERCDLCISNNAEFTIPGIRKILSYDMVKNLLKYCSLY